MGPCIKSEAAALGSEKHLSRAGVGKLLQGQKVNMLGLWAMRSLLQLFNPAIVMQKQSLTLCKWTGMAENETVGMASPTQWTWVWETSGDSEGQERLVCCSPWGHNWVTEQQQLLSEGTAIIYCSSRTPFGKFSIFHCLLGHLCSRCWKAYVPWGLLSSAFLMPVHGWSFRVLRGLKVSNNHRLSKARVLFFFLAVWLSDDSVVTFQFHLPGATPTVLSRLGS